MNGDRRNAGESLPSGPDETFDRDLERIRAAWSRQERIVPPDLVDRAVLNAARRATEQAPRRARWVGALATACVVVLAVTVVLQQDREANGPLPEVDEMQLQDAVSTGERFDEEPAATAVEPARPTARFRDASKPPTVESRVAPGSERPRAEAAVPTPEDWIERLEQLRQAGDRTTFEAERAAFRSAYPDYPLPPELRD